MKRIPTSLVMDAALALQELNVPCAISFAPSDTAADALESLGGTTKKRIHARAGGFHVVREVECSFGRVTLRGQSLPRRATSDEVERAGEWRHGIDGARGVVP